MDREDILKKSPLFKGVSSAAMSLLSAAAEIENLSDGEVLFGEGTTPEKLFIVASGAIDLIKRMDDRKGLVVLKIETYEEVELNNFMDRKPYFLAAIAPKKASVLAISERDLWGILAEDPESEHAFLVNVIKEQSDTLRRINERFREFLAQVLNW
ncbi:MAG: Crp/Fnr family transcriptional regulator [bacterium]|nr:Crp/Fnr family transcriptional regulator [bacterium]